MLARCCNSPSSPVEAPIPWPHDCNEKEPTRSRGLVRKPSKLQMSVEVVRCRFGSIRRRPTKKEDGELNPQKQWTPIYHAVYHNREAALLHFLQAGGSPDDVDNTGLPPICIAAASGHTRMIELLLEAGVDVNAPTKTTGETALHLAIKNGHNDTISLLLAQGPNTKSRTIETGETCLHYASSKIGSLSTVVALLKAGADCDVKNRNNQSPAEVALKANNLQAAIAIINAARGKPDAMVKEKEMLLKHIEKSRVSTNNDLIADVFETACDPDSTVLVEAIKRNDLSLIEMFLERGADPDRGTAKGLRPIFAALKYGGAQTIHALIKHNVDVTVQNSNGQSVLQMALESLLIQDKEALLGVFSSLLSTGASPMVTYPDGKTLLHHAVMPNICHPKIANMLLEQGINIEAQDIDGNSALHLAAYDASCTKVLLKHGADPHRANKERLTPLLYAMTHARKATEPDFDPLIRVSDLRRTGAQNRTPLHIAASKGLEKTTRGLLRAGSATATLDSTRNTPLLLAVQGQQWPIVSLLATLPGANLWGDDGMTALHHIATSPPRAPATWLDIASAIKPFCERGTSRSMRNRAGATPLIQAVVTLPDEGLPVVEELLSQRGERTISRSCVDHEDHKRRDALYYAVTLGKHRFVETLLRHGASFDFGEWSDDKTRSHSSTEGGRIITRHLAQAEWMRRVLLLRGQTSLHSSASPTISEVLPVRDLTSLLNMGLDPNALPKSSLGTSLLWAILRQVLPQPPSPHLSDYLHDTLRITLKAGADPNLMATGPTNRSADTSQQSPPLTYHPLTHLLEETPSVDAKLIALLLTHGTALTTPSPFYAGRHPLHTAVTTQRTDIVTALLARRADTNAPTTSGHTPLFLAARTKSLDILDALLRFGARTDAADAEGNTALHAAVRSGGKDVVARLLRAGAEAAARNKRGMTPRECLAAPLEAEGRKIELLLRDAEAREVRERERAREKTQVVKAPELVQAAQSTKSSPLLAPPASPPHRADSGVGHGDVRAVSEAAAKRQSGGELAGWLAVSKMLGDL